MPLRPIPRYPSVRIDGATLPGRQNMAIRNQHKSARHRAGLKAKKHKERARKAGLMKVRRAGGRLRIRHSKEYKAQTFR